jgi:excisionase family DNA binding protein
MNSPLHAELGDQRVMTEAEAARFLRTSVRKMRRLRANNEIRFTRVGKTPMYRLSDLIEYLDRQEVRPNGPSLMSHPARRI